MRAGNPASGPCVSSNRAAQPREVSGNAARSSDGGLIPSPRGVARTTSEWSGSRSDKRVGEWPLISLLGLRHPEHLDVVPATPRSVHQNSLT